MKNATYRSLFLPLACLGLVVSLIIYYSDSASNSSSGNAMMSASTADSASSDMPLPSFIEVPMTDMSAAQNAPTDDMPLKMLKVSQYEVSIAEWKTCVQAGGCPDIPISPHSDENHPMTQVSWYDASQYIRWFSESSGKQVRLPTQQEWISFAADHLHTQRKKLFQDPRLAWAADYNLDAEQQSKLTQQAGEFGQNALGVADLEGNVWEWTQDTCDGDDIWGIADCGSGRVAMGEHVSILSDFVRDPGNAGCGGGIPPPNVGFRLVYQDEA